MYRIIAIVGGALALAACSSDSQLANLDIFKPKPVMETVQFQSEPPGAEVKLTNGQTCRTPCTLALSSTGTYTATYTLDRYEPATETIAPTSMGDNTTQLRPNPVMAQLTAAPPPKRKVRHRARRKKPVHRPAEKKPAPPAKPQAEAPAPAPAPAPASPPPAAQQAPSPWPPVQQQQ